MAKNILMEKKQKDLYGVKIGKKITLSDEEPIYLGDKSTRYTQLTGSKRKDNTYKRVVRETIFDAKGKKATLKEVKGNKMTVDFGKEGIHTIPVAYINYCKTPEGKKFCYSKK